MIAVLVSYSAIFGFGVFLVFLYCVFLFLRKEIREANPGWWRPRWSWIYTRKKDMPPEIDGPKWWEKEAR